MSTAIAHAERNARPIARRAARLRREIAGLAVALLALAPALAAHAAEVVDVRLGRHAEFTRVVFELDSRAGYKIVRKAGQAGGEDLFVYVEAGSSETETLRVGKSPLGRVDVKPRDGATVARLQVSEPNLVVKEMILSKPPRIVLDVVHPAAARPASASKPAAPKAAQPAPSKTAQPAAPKPKPAAPKPATSKPPQPAAAPPATAPVEKAAPATPPAGSEVAPTTTTSAAKPAPRPAASPMPAAAPEDTPEARPTQLAAAPKTAPAPTAETAAPKAPASAARPTPSPTSPPTAAPSGGPPGTSRSEPPHPETAGGPRPPTADTARAPSAGASTPRPAPPTSRPAPTPPARAVQPAAGDSGISWSTIGIALAGAGVVLIVIFVWLRRRGAAQAEEMMEEFQSEAGDSDDPFAGLRSAPETPQSDDSTEIVVPPASAAADEEPSLFADDSTPAAAPGQEEQKEAEMDVHSDTEAPTVANLGAPPMGEAGGDVAQLVRELERRLAHMESRLDEEVDARERLERQVAAQTEELRVQRAAIARTQRALRNMTRSEDEAATEPAPRESS